MIALHGGDFVFEKIVRLDRQGPVDPVATKEDSCV
jgi:hypothetical protein